MRLQDVIGVPAPTPWGEADNIPWNDPAFSERMLREHLSQAHNAASRRAATIDEHVRWIDGQLARRPSRILDLGCGPGLYASRLAQRGHQCTGVDYSPASIAYAREVAEREHLTCTYVEADIRLAEIDQTFDLVMLISGELNVFSRPSAHTVLNNAHRVLSREGLLILEVHPYDSVREKGGRSRSWYSAASGVFSDSEHICLQEQVWHDDTQAVAIRYIIVDAASGDVEVYGQSFQAYTTADYDELLEECGFDEPQRFASLSGGADADPQFEVLVAKPR